MAGTSLAMSANERLNMIGMRAGRMLGGPPRVDNVALVR
jgi:hypothetical protein